MIQWLLKTIVGSKNQREVRRMMPIVAKINEIESGYQKLSDDQLKAKTVEFRARLEKGETLDDLLPEAFAAVKNCCRRFTESKHEIEVRGQKVTWEMIPFDVQLVGGMVLHRGKISEMGTGEGKTLVATLPTYLNALPGKGVHVVTVNDYLAARDSEWMGEIYRWLGLTVGCIQRDMDPPERRLAYACDITYGTNTELGFDYLRDNGMATNADSQVQRGYNFAIVDEVDSILIDEARVPLIIAGPVTAEVGFQFPKYKPMIERLVHEQTRLCNRMVSDARKQAEEGDMQACGALMFRVKMGNPQNNQLAKMQEDPELRAAMEDYEVSLYSDPQRRELYALKEELYFSIDEKARESDLSAKGREFISPNDPDAFVVPDLITLLHDINADKNLSTEERAKKAREAQANYEQATERIHTISQLLKAYCTLEKDVHYVIQDNKVVIVDENTGRALPGRRWSDGLHGAVEAKENVTIDKETQTLATITIQNYFRLYAKLAGMTGTAETEANEFHDIYKLDVVVIPANRPTARADDNDAIYKTRREKYNAVVREVKECHAEGQPMLIGTVSVEASELLSRMIKRENIPHTVLNAKYHQQEAEIVARAGQRGAITIATNMAGRGTDIKLGPGVKEVGGLRVVGTERHESRRIDRQLRGRCARQGDPGESRFYISFEDDLMRNFGDSRKLAGLMSKFGMEDDEELEHPWLNKSVENAQKRVEERNYSIRKHTLQYDDVMNLQRGVVYDFRNEVIHSDDPRTIIFDVLEEVIEARAEAVFESATPSSNENHGEGGASPQEDFVNWINTTFPLTVELKEVESLRDAKALTALGLQKVRDAYAVKSQFEDKMALVALERYMVLSALDRLWQEHLYSMDSLRQSIGLRSYGQKDPLVEYKHEASTMFEEMMGHMKEEIANNVFRTTTVMSFEDFMRNMPSRFLQQDVSQVMNEQAALSGNAPQPSASGGPASGMDSGAVSEALAEALQPVRRTVPKVGRNEPCPCGSGKKYKNCHGRSED